MTKLISKPNIVLGEVLFDIFPGERCLGGAPFNFAFHLHCLGAPVVFISRVGEDQLGREILDFAGRYDFPTEGIQTDADHSTGEVKVTLDQSGGPKFAILPDRAFDYIELNPFLRTLLEFPPPLVYFGTLAQRNTASQKTILDTLHIISNRSTLFMDLNLRAPFYHRDLIESSLGFCDVLKVSGEELEELGRILETPENSVANIFIRHLQETYKIKWVCVTEGEKGSALYGTETTDPIYQPSSPQKSIKDTVGAGDAFSAMLAFGLLQGLPEPLILERASLFASEVCSLKGGLPKSRDFYIPFGGEND